MINPLHEDEDEAALYARYLSSFGDDAEPAIQAPPVAAPAAAAPANDNAGDDIYAQYLAGAANEPAPAPQSSYREPPKSQDRSNGGLYLAMALDALLNKGSGIPGYVAAASAPDDAEFENYMRTEGAMDRASVRDARMAAPGGDASLAYRMQRDAQAAELKKRMSDPNSAESKQARERIYDVNPDMVGKLDKWSALDIENSPAMGVLTQRLKGEDKLENWQTQQERRETEAREMEGIRQGNRIATIDHSAGLKEKHTKDERAYKQSFAEIPGWERAPNAPPATEKAINEAGETAVGLEQLRESIGTIQALNAQITEQDRAAAKLGKQTALTARYSEEIQNAANAIRKIANFGTPQAAELAITYERLPRVDSVDAWMNGQVKYQAVIESLQRQAEASMRVRGYRPAGRGNGMKQEAPPEPAEPRVWDLDELQEVTP